MASKKYIRPKKKSKKYITKGTGQFNKRPKRRATNKTKTQIRREQLYRNTRDVVNEVNKRLRSLHRQGIEGTWASRKLLERLDMKKGIKVKNTKQGLQVQLVRGYTTPELRQLNKAGKQFVMSKTSTKRGIEEVKNDTLETLRKTLSTEFDNISEDDAEFYYNMLNDDDFRSFADRGKASEVWYLISDFKNIFEYSELNNKSINESVILYNETKNDFIEKVGIYTNTQLDDDMIERLGRIYDTYVL